MWIDAGVGRLLPPQLKSYYDDLPFTIPGLGVIVLIVSMILIGMFAAGFVGSFLSASATGWSKDAGHFQRLLFAETGV